MGSPPPRVNPVPAAGAAVEPSVSPAAAVVLWGAEPRTKELVGVPLPNEKPPPAAVFFAGVPNAKPPVGLVLACAEVPKVKPPPEGAVVEVAIPNPVVGAAVVFCPKENPPGTCPKLNPPLIFPFNSVKTSTAMLQMVRHFLGCFGGSKKRIN